MPRPLLDLPAACEVPPDVRAALRAVSPHAELLYVGQGEWWLGEVVEERARAAAGRAKLARLRRRGGRVAAFRQAHAMAAGFSLLEILHGDPQAAWADRLARYLGATTQAVDAAAEATLARAEGADVAERRTANLRAFVRSGEAASIHRFARRATDGGVAHAVPSLPGT